MGTLDGKTWYHIKYDNTAPKTAFLFTYLPYNMEHPWTYEGGREHTANGGFTMTHKITHGENVIQEGEMVFDVKTNDGSKFEMEHLHKMTRTVTYDKKNRNFLLGKVFVEDKLVLDGERFGHFKLDTRATPYTMVWFSKPVRRLVPITT